MTDRLAYRIPEACKMLGISRSTFYRLVEDGDLAIKKLKSVTLVTRASLDRFLGQPPDATPDLAQDAETH